MLKNIVINSITLYLFCFYQFVYFVFLSLCSLAASAASSKRLLRWPLPETKNKPPAIAMLRVSGPILRYVNLSGWSQSTYNAVVMISDIHAKIKATAQRPMFNKMNNDNERNNPPITYIITMYYLVPNSIPNVARNFGKQPCASEVASSDGEINLCIPDVINGAVKHIRPK